MVEVADVVGQEDTIISEGDAGDGLAPDGDSQLTELWKPAQCYKVYTDPMRRLLLAPGLVSL